MGAEAVARSRGSRRIRGRELNTFLPQYPQVIVCLYDLDQFDGRVVVDLLRTHPKILLCGTLLDNPYYLEPHEFLASQVLAPA